MILSLSPSRTFFVNHISPAPLTGARWRASAWRVCTRWRGCPRVSPVPGGRSKPRAFPSTTHANPPRSPDLFHVVSNRTRFGTPSSPSEGPDTKARACSSRHANAQAVGDDTEQRVYTFGRRSYSQSICSPQVRACLVLACLRFLLPKRRVLTKLFSLFDAQSGTVSLRRSTMPNDG
jgi:hypothetical protein